MSNPHANPRPPRTLDMAKRCRRTRHGALHVHQPAGHKLLRKWARKKYGKHVTRALIAQGRLYSAYQLMGAHDAQAQTNAS